MAGQCLSAFTLSLLEDLALESLDHLGSGATGVCIIASAIIFIRWVAIAPDRISLGLHYFLPQETLPYWPSQHQH